MKAAAAATRKTPMEAAHSALPQKAFTHVLTILLEKVYPETARVGECVR